MASRRRKRKEIAPASVVQHPPAYLVQLSDRGYVQVAEARKNLKELLGQSRTVPLVRYSRVIGVLVPVPDVYRSWSGDMGDTVRKVLLRAARECKPKS